MKAASSLASVNFIVDPSSVLDALYSGNGSALAFPCCKDIGFGEMSVEDHDGGHGLLHDHLWLGS